MRPFLIVLMLVFSHPVVAQTSMVFHNREVTVQLLRGECSNATVRAAIPPEHLPEFRAATVTWRGRLLHACWMLLPNAQVMIVDADLDYGTLPVSAFKPGAGV